MGEGLSDGEGEGLSEGEGEGLSVGEVVGLGVSDLVGFGVVGFGEGWGRPPPVGLGPGALVSVAPGDGETTAPPLDPPGRVGIALSEGDGARVGSPDPSLGDGPGVKTVAGAGG